jgi:hypothetical protein
MMPGLHRHGRESLRGARLALGLALVALAAGGATAADTAPPPTVLLLFSLRSTAPAVPEAERAFRSEVEKVYNPLNIQVEHLDVPDESAARYAADRGLLREKYAGRRIDVVVTCASGPLSRNREVLFPSVGGVLGREPASVEDAGCLGRDRVRGTVDRRTIGVALDLHPEARGSCSSAAPSPQDKASGSSPAGSSRRRPLAWRSSRWADSISRTSSCASRSSAGTA